MTDLDAYEPFEPFEVPDDVWPLVATTGKGGRYDSMSFAAGRRIGQIDVELAAAARDQARQYVVTVFHDLVPQVELMGMKYGFAKMTAKPHPEPVEGWHLVTLERS